MYADVTLRFEDPDEAEAFLEALGRGHVDGRRLWSLKGGLEVVGEGHGHERCPTCGR